MSKYRTLALPSTISEGDIIEYRPQNAVARRSGKVAYGYVHHVGYLTAQQDDVSTFEVFPIMPRTEAQAMGKLFIEVDSIDGFVLGLPQPSELNTWHIVIDRTPIEPGKKGTGRNDGLIQRIGNIYNTPTFDKIQDHIQDNGGEAKLYTEGLGPKLRQSDDMLFGHFTPLGIKGGKKRDALTAFEGEEVGNKNKRKNKAYDKAGYEPDITLPNAVRAGLITPDLAKAFHSVSGLRALKDLAKDKPDAFNEGVKNVPALEKDVTFADLPDTTPMVDDIWRVMYPKDAGTTPRLETLKQAYEFVTQDGNSLTAYQNVDQKLADKATKQIITAYGRMSKEEGVTPEKIDGAEKSIKTAWKDFMHEYTAFAVTGDVSERMIDENQQPLWTSVPVFKPRG